MASGTGKLLTKSELAQFLGVSLTAVTNWVRTGCPWVERGSVGKSWTFNLAEVVAWREERAVQQALGDTKQLNLDEARRRKVAAEAAMVELDLAKRRGEVIEIADVAGLVGEDYANLRAKLLSMPTKLAPIVATESDLAQCKALLERGVEEALEELTADGIYSAEESPGEGAEGTAETKPKAAA